MSVYLQKKLDFQISRKQAFAVVRQCQLGKTKKTFTYVAGRTNESQVNIGRFLNFSFFHVLKNQSHCICRFGSSGKATLLPAVCYFKVMDTLSLPRCQLKRLSMKLVLLDLADSGFKIWITHDIRCRRTMRRFYDLFAAGFSYLRFFQPKTDECKSCLTWKAHIASL